MISTRQRLWSADSRAIAILPALVIHTGWPSGMFAVVQRHRDEQAFAAPDVISAEDMNLCGLSRLLLLYGLVEGPTHNLISSTWSSAITKHVRPAIISCMRLVSFLTCCKVCIKPTKAAKPTLSSCQWYPLLHLCPCLNLDTRLLAEHSRCVGPIFGCKDLSES